MRTSIIHQIVEKIRLYGMIIGLIHLCGSSLSSQQKVEVIGNLDVTNHMSIDSNLTTNGSVYIYKSIQIEGYDSDYPLSIYTISEEEFIDQVQTSGNLDDSNSSSWQSFTSGMDGVLRAIEVKYDFVSSNDTHRLRIYEGEGTSGHIMYDETKTFGFGTNVWRKWNNINLALQEGSIYTLRVNTRCCGGNFENNTGIKYSNGNPYLDGISSKSDTSDFCFKTIVSTPASAMTLDHLGNVGIGVDSATQKMDIDGKIRMRDGASNGFIPVSDGDGVMTWTNPTDIIVEPEWINIQNIPAGFADGIDNNDDDWMNNNNDIYFQEGRVAIGTNTPVSKLTLLDSVQNSLTIKTIDNAKNTGIGFQNSGSNYAWNIFREDVGSNTSDFVVAGGTTSANIENLPERMKITHEGSLLVDDQTFTVNALTNRVGIGTSNPTKELEVNGGVLFQEEMEVVGDVRLDNNTFTVNAATNRVGIGEFNPVNMVDVSGGMVIGASYSGTETAPLNGALIQGTVGIGETNPLNKLDVDGGVAIGSSFSGTLTAPTNGAIIQGSTGIGVKPKNKFDVKGSVAIGGTYAGIDGAPSDGAIIEGNVGIGTNSPGSFKLAVSGTAAKTGGGLWLSFSDRRLKKDISEYTEGLDKILAIHPVKFKYNEKSGYETDKEYIGVIAQELKEVAPYMVEPTLMNDKEYLTVDNSAMIYMLINAVKEQQQIIENLQKQNEALKAMSDAKLSGLQDQIDHIQTLIKQN